MDSNDRIESDFLDRLYAVAMEPERFGELIDIWHERINHALADGQLADEAELRHLESHLGRAETLLDLVTTHEDLLPKALDEKMQASPHAILAIDHDALIRAQNDAARKLYGSVADAPLTSLPFDQDALTAIAKYVESALAGNDQSASLIQAHDSETGRLSLLSLMRWRTAGGRQLVLAKTIDFTWPAALTPLVREAFSLTGAEAEVMQLLAEGSTAAEIAEQRGASLATVRTQIRSIYEKTDTRNQSEFMRMALGLSSLDLIDRQVLTGALQAPKHDGQAAFPRPEDSFMLTLPDGRIMDYAVFGPEDGRPCLFMHNEFFGNIWPAAAVERAHELGMRIIAPARPCYGRSTCPADKTPTPEEIAADIVYLLDRLNVERVVMLFQVSGGITALALAEQFPERAAGMALVTPLYPSATGHAASKLPFHHKFLSSVTERHPRLLDFICRSGYAFHNRVGTRNFLAKFAHDHPADLVLLDDPLTLADMVAGVEYCTTHDHRGFFTDYRHMPRDSLARFLALDLPIVAVLGAEVDPSRYEMVTELVSRHDRTESMIAEGGGHYLHFSHPRLMSEALAKVWDRALVIE